VILLVLGALFAVACAWAVQRWWLGLRLVLVLLVLEGAVRKWLLPEHQQLVYLAKDALLLAVYVGFIADRRHVRRVTIPPSIQLPLVLCMAWGALEIFNPKLPAVLVGLFGWKAYFWYAPLLWVVPAAFRDLEDLEKFLRRYLQLTLPVVALGLVQFRAPADSPLNRYAWGGEEGFRGIATFGEAGAARVTGTFSYITGFSTFLVVAGVLLLVLLAGRDFRWRGNAWTWAALGAVPLGVLVTGSRGPLILLAGLLPVLALLARRGAVGVVAGVGRLLVVGGLLAAFVSFAGAPALEAFSYRARTSGEDLGTRMLAPFVEPVDLMGEVGLFGSGIGATHQAAPSLVPDLRPGSWLEGLVAEVESSRVMIELGPLGFLLEYACRVAIAGVALAGALRLATPRARALALGAAFFCASQIPGTIVVNVTGGLYFWFLAGAYFLAQACDREGFRASAARSAAAGVPRVAPLAMRGPG